MESGTGAWITYAVNALIVGATLILAKVSGQIVTKTEVFEAIKAASEATTASILSTLIERERHMASRDDLHEAIRLSIEAFSRIDIENDRLMVERYTEPMRAIIERMEKQQERFISTLDNLNASIARMWERAPRPVP